MSDRLTYTGILTELGGPELGNSGNEKPRKVVVKADPSKQFGKTFRCWNDSLVWNDLEALGIGKQVIVEYTIEHRTDKDGNQLKAPNGEPIKPSNALVAVLQDGAGGGQAALGGEVEENPPTPASDDSWDIVSAPTFDGRTLEIESAWAIKAVLDRTPNDKDISHSQLVEQALKLVLLKREVAHELAK